MSRLEPVLRPLRSLPAPVRWLAAPVVLLACTGALLLTGGDYQPPTAAPHPDARAAALCRPFMAALPASLLGAARTDAAQDVAVYATHPRTVVRCGVPRPKSLDRHQQDLGPNVNGVQWYDEDDGHGGHRFTLTQRPNVYVEVAAPAGATRYPADALGVVSPAVAATLPDLSGDLNADPEQ
ncbi:hypothetical protein C7C46_30240 [Streptomyces tateyamensis]|uniref:DUF3515 domain-containing protein n=1 Tax=Streptomyces tateyamensis TaxID=565073 RepID=A0A2V4NY21_9ACTN|nr:DUF3515 family protein [Streptomyces tateyamensis]PYC67421.1 hypothetical protein C7C46_30240 [Streptomyces tateyamensis]